VSASWDIQSALKASNLYSKKIQTIVAEFQEPATVKGFRRFLGMFNFYSLSQRPLLQAPLLNVISERKRNNNAKIK